MALLTPYCTVTYANTVNQGNSEWDALSTTQKTTALTQGRYYLDSHYSCVEIADMDIDDKTTVPDEYQLANALIGYEHAKGTLYTYDATGGQSIVKKDVKADTVEVSTTYSGYMQGNVKRGDPYPNVTALMSVYCSLGSSQTLVRV